MFDGGGVCATALNSINFLSASSKLRTSDLSNTILLRVLSMKASRSRIWISRGNSCILLCSLQSCPLTGDLGTLEFPHRCEGSLQPGNPLSHGGVRIHARDNTSLFRTSQNCLDLRLRGRIVWANAANAASKLRTTGGRSWLRTGGIELHPLRGMKTVFFRP